jgi:hypothetical protein
MLLHGSLTITRRVCGLSLYWPAIVSCTIQNEEPGCGLRKAGLLSRHGTDTALPTLETFQSSLLVQAVMVHHGRSGEDFKPG